MSHPTHSLPQALTPLQGQHVSKRIRDHLKAEHGIDWTEHVNFRNQHAYGLPVQTLDNVEFTIVRDNGKALEVLTDPDSPYYVVKQTPTRIFVRVLANEMTKEN